MKVLLINGSPKENGNTFTALSEVAKKGYYCYQHYEWDDATGEKKLTGRTDFSWDGTTSSYSWDSTTNKFVDTKEYGLWGSTGAETYEKLQFDKATGWSRWLKLNEQEPNLVSPTTNNDKWDESYIYDRRK